RRGRGAGGRVPEALEPPRPVVLAGELVRIAPRVPAVGSVAAEGEPREPDADEGHRQRVVLDRATQVGCEAPRPGRAVAQVIERLVEKLARAQPIAELG